MKSTTLVFFFFATCAEEEVRRQTVRAMGRCGKSGKNGVQNLKLVHHSS
jgi:hypothetical protein